MKSVFLLGMILSQSAFALCSYPQVGRQMGTISIQGLKENSGMDFSRINGDVLWSHNDAKNDSKIFAYDHQGQSKGEFRVVGAQNFDWEDISVSSCYYDNKKECIYIADIGNNDGDRTLSTIYVVEEPTSLMSQDLRISRQIEFKSPMGINFEAFAYDEFNAQFFLISKAKKKSETTAFYTLSNDGRTLKTITSLNLEGFSREKNDSIVTSMDYEARTGSILIGTYGQAYEISAKDIMNFSSKARVIPMPALEQAESITYGYNAGKTSIWTTSEGKNQPLIQIECQ